MKINFWKSKSSNVQTFYNVLSTIIRTGITFFTMPLFTRILGTEQYGVYSVYESWFNVLVCIMGLSCGSSLATAMYKYKNDFQRYKSSLLICGTVINVGLIIVASVLYNPFSKFMEYPFVIYQLLFVEAFAAFVTAFANSIWTYEKSAVKNMVLALTTIFTTTVLSIVLLFYWPGSSDDLYIGRVLGVALPNIMIAAVVWNLIFWKKPTGYIKEYWGYGISFGIPVIFHQLSHKILTSSDRIMMQYFNINNGEIGIYSFFYSFTAILSAILVALNNSWCPFLYEDLDKKAYKKLNKKVGYYVQIYTVVTCGFLMLSREFSKLFADKGYWSGMLVIPIIVLAMYCTFIYQFPVNYEFFKSKTKVIATGTAIAATENICLNALMIPQWGMYGAAIATLISYATLVLIHIFIVRNWKEEKYPLSYKYNVLGFVVVLLFCVLFYVLADLIIVRWIIAFGLGIYLIRSVIKRRTVF